MSAPENESALTEPPAPEPAPDAAPEPDAVPAPGAAPRRLPRAAGIALATAGLLAVTAASAAVTVAVGKPDTRPAAAAPAAPTAAPASTSTSASPTASAAPAPVPTAVPAQPKPASTVKGSVSGARHEGDLRYFLLPVPDGGEPYGPADGIAMTRDDVGDLFGQQDGLDRILDGLGYKDGATRTYRTADGTAQVTVTLLHFGSADTASRFVKGYTIDSQEPVDVAGDPNAHGFLRKPKHEAYTGSMTGISSQGDVEYTVDVEVKGTPDKALLSDLMKRQREWLASGG